MQNFKVTCSICGTKETLTKDPKEGTTWISGESVLLNATRIKFQLCLSCHLGVTIAKEQKVFRIQSKNTAKPIVFITAGRNYGFHTKQKKEAINLMEDAISSCHTAKVLIDKKAINLRKALENSSISIKVVSLKKALSKRLTAIYAFPGAPAEIDKLDVPTTIIL